MKQFLQRIFFWLLLVFTIFLIFRPWFTTEVICRGDCVYFFADNLKSFFDVPLFWNTSPVGSGLGYFALPTLTFSPPHFLLGFFYQLFGFNYEILEKIIFYIPFLFFSCLGMLYLTQVLGLSRVGRFFATIFYIANTYILLVVDGGQVGIALAYSLVPIVFAFFIKGLGNQEQKSKILSGLLMGFLMLFDLRVAYLLFGLIFLYVLFNILGKEFKKTIPNTIQSLVLVLIIPLGLHFFWIVPLFWTRTAAISSFYTQSSQVDFLSWMNLLNGLFLFQPHWPTNIFGKINPIQSVFFLIPFLVFLNLLIYKKKKEIFFFVFLALVSIFLIKGSREPAGNIYRWLFTNFPGFNMFRDPSKFYIPLVFSYSLLIAFTAEWFSKKRLGKVFVGLLFLYLVFLIKPVLLGEMTGTFKPEVVSGDYLKIKNLIAEDKNFFRSVWYPNKREFSYSSPQHPTLDATLDLAGRRPFDIAIGGTYDLFSYLEHPFTCQLFDVLGIKYVFASDSLKKHTLSESDIKDRERLLGVLGRTFWLKKMDLTGQISSFQTSSATDHFFVVPKTFWVVGSDNLYWTLDTFPNFKLRNLGLVYLDELQSFPEQIEKPQTNDYLVFNNKEWLDLAWLLIDKKYFISPAQQLSNQKLPDKSWIVKNSFDFIAWRDVLAHKGFGNLDFDFRQGFVLADDNPQTLDFSFELPSKTSGGFYVRYFSNRLGGKFLIKIDGQEIKSLSTNSLRDNFIWEKLSFLDLKKGKHTITLENKKGFNAINIFAFLPEKEIIMSQQQAKEIMAKNKIISFYEPGEATKSGGINFAKSGQFEILTQVPAYFKNLRLQIKVGGQTLASVVKTNLDRSEWYSFGEINLKEGFNEVEIPPQVGEIIFFQTDKKEFKEFLVDESTLPTITYQFINPTKYLLTVRNSKAPFTLIFSESYHPLWEAKIDNQTFQPIPVYSIINGFNIPRTGDFKMVVEFSPQRMFWLASLVSVIFLLLTGSALLFFIIACRKPRTFRPRMNAKSDYILPRDR